MSLCVMLVSGITEIDFFELIINVIIELKSMFKLIQARLDLLNSLTYV